MALYSIGDVAERCGINPITLRAWQRRYGLLKPQRTEGGHRLFDDDDMARILEIKRWIDSGIPVGKVRDLLEGQQVDAQDSWSKLQDEIANELRQQRPGKLRTRLFNLGREYPIDAVIDRVWQPLRQRLSLDQSTAKVLLSVLDGMLTEYACFCLAGARKKAGDDALLVGWHCKDRTRLWLEALRLSQKGWRITVLAEPLTTLKPEHFAGQHVLLCSDKPLTRPQMAQVTEWQRQGYPISACQPGETP
ncbi:MerR family transcriptional regulator [Pantoea sp. 1.19]|uniref:MerR family transcriptional regulator n=1 Tax=Pantoea sp. 1.19 TaxID=1925589 RepID=UPI00094895F4|nr:MerR family transcriptional regulator [Pantoea sp. 1.19]